MVARLTVVIKDKNSFEERLATFIKKSNEVCGHASSKPLKIKKSYLKKLRKTNNAPITSNE